MAPRRNPRIARIGARPDQIGDALEAEHRVVDEERNRVDAVRRVGRAGGDERRHRAGLGDPLFEDLAVLRLLVIEERVHVDRLVLLADVRVDADGAEERLHAERARLVGNDRHDQVADFLVAQQLRQHPHEHHRRRRLAPFGALVELLEDAARSARAAARRGRCACGTNPPSALRRSRRYCSSGAVVGRPVERRVGNLLVGDRNAESRAERAQVRLVHLLLLVRDVLAFARFAESVALDRAGEDDGRLPLVLDRRLVGVVDLDRIVAAEAQPLQLLVRQVLHHVEQPRIGAEEVLAHVRADFDRVLLILAVDDSRPCAWRAGRRGPWRAADPSRCPRSP